MNERRRVSKTPLSAERKWFKAYITGLFAGVYCRRLLPAFIKGPANPRICDLDARKMSNVEDDFERDVARDCP
jgi:hypothetical protein